MPKYKTILMVLVILVFFVGLAIYEGRLWAPGDPIRDHSMFRSNAWGTKALADLCNANDLRVSPWLRPLSSLSKKERALCIFDPTSPPHTWSVQDLVDWVKQGGWLLLAVDPDPAHEAGLLPPPVPPNQLLLTAFGLRSNETVVIRSHAIPLGGGPLVAGVRQVYVPGPYRLQPGSSGYFHQQRQQFGTRKAKSYGLRPLVTLHWRTLLRDKEGDVALAASCGRGQVIAVSDVEIFSDQNLAQADNVLFAADLLYSAGVRQVYVDEALHGFGSGLDERGGGLDPTRGKWALYLVLLALVLYFGSRLQRFGAPQPVISRPRRSALEFVDALADLYRRARARQGALEILARTFRLRLAMRSGASPDLSARELAAIVAARYPLEEARLRDLLSELADSATGQVNEAQLLHLSRLMAAYEEVVARGR